MPATVRDRTVDWPLWWFARLEAAVERGDHAAAAEAQCQLERLGVSVRYGRPRHPCPARPKVPRKRTALDA
jgi:hypothetical protein